MDYIMYIIIVRSLIRQIIRTYHLAGAEESKIVLANVVSLSTLTAIAFILPIIILPYLFRILGPDKFGLIAFASAFIQYFMILTDYGFSVSATKEISLYRHDHKQVCSIFSSVLCVKLVMTLVCFVILCIMVSTIPKFKNDWLIYAISFGAVIGNALFPIWLFQGMEKMRYIASINIIVEVIVAFFILAFVKTPQDFILVPAFTSMAMIISGLSGLYIAFAHFGMKFQKVSLSTLNHVFKNGWHVFTSIIAINMYTTTRVFAIGLLSNNILTGYYAMAEKIASIIQTFPLSSFASAIFPRMNKLFQKSKAHAFDTMVQVQEITLKIAFIGIPIFIAVAPIVVKVVCGGAYPEITMTLRLLLLSIFFVSGNAFRVQFLLVCGQNRRYAQIHMLAACLGLPLILFLVGKLYIVGAALATLSIEAGIFLLTAATLKKFKF